MRKKGLIMKQEAIPESDLSAAPASCTQQNVGFFFFRRIVPGIKPKVIVNCMED